MKLYFRTGLTLHREMMYRLIILVFLFSGLMLTAQNRRDLQDDDWEDMVSFPYEIEGEFSKVDVSIKETVNSVTKTRWLYRYEVNENMEPLLFRVYNEDVGNHVADYIYTYSPGEEVRIVKKREPFTYYEWKLRYNEVYEEVSYVNNELNYRWTYDRSSPQETTITKLKKNEKPVYTWYIESDDQGRVERSYRVNGKKVTQFLSHQYEEESNKHKVYYFNKKALQSLEIGLSLDRDSIIQMEPKTIASMYYRPVPITSYAYTDDDKIASYAVKTQAGRTITQDQYMYDRDGLLVQKVSSNYTGLPITEKYFYGDNGKIASKIRTIQVGNESYERTHTYSYNSENRLIRIEIRLSDSPHDLLEVNFKYTD
ncbi:hypothetical protein O3Q51_17230 [Cryomorphaceae bacterium 1068]|nr:hypothetical protein [Cryomorphaceae bacterium 1068]